MKVCKYCIGKFGFKLSDTEKTFKTDEELYEHVENVHGLFVMREGETEKDAEERCAKKGIVADRSICQCEECKILRGEEFVSPDGRRFKIGMSKKKLSTIGWEN